MTPAQQAALEQLVSRSLTADEIADKILDYDHVAFCDVANRVTLYK